MPKKPIEVVNPDDEPEQPESTAIPVVSLEEAIEGPRPAGGTSFWIGEVQLLEFEDGTTYHAAPAGIHTIHDPKLIANLDKAALVKSNRIFRQ